MPDDITAAASLYNQLYGTMPAKKVKPVPKAALPERPAYILPYIKGSRSAKALSKAIGAFRTTSNLATVQPLKIDVINWGNAKLENSSIFTLCLAVPGSKVFNNPKAVSLTRNKLKLFKHFQKSEDGPRIPEFFDELEAAMLSLKAGAIIFGRKTTGSCGTDIVQFDEDANRFNNSDFWVVYKKKKAEYRIHIFKVGDEYKIIDRQQKVLRETDPLTDAPIDKSTVNFMIRNHKNGFIFKRHDLDVPKDVEEQAIKAMKLSGLDFGAVDVIWNEYEKKAYVLEINSAPGLEGTTLDNYVTQFKELGIGSPNVVQEPEVVAPVWGYDLR